MTAPTPGLPRRKMCVRDYGMFRSVQCWFPLPEVVANARLDAWVDGTITVGLDMGERGTGRIWSIDAKEVP